MSTTRIQLTNIAWTRIRTLLSKSGTVEDILILERIKKAFGSSLLEEAATSTVTVEELKAKSVDSLSLEELILLIEQEQDTEQLVALNDRYMALSFGV